MVTRTDNFYLGFLILLCSSMVSPVCLAQTELNKLVGVGVDSAGRPWVAGTWDTGGDGNPDRLQMMRYTTSGIEDFGFKPEEDFEVGLNLYGGSGVDRSDTGARDQPWLIWDRDVEPDGSRNDFASRRYQPGTGNSSLGYGLDVANPQIGTILRAGGTLQTNILGNPIEPHNQLVLSILQSGPNAGKAQISRFNDIGQESLGGVVQFGQGNDLIPNTISGVGAGNQAGSPISSLQNLLFITGANSNGIEEIKSYSLETYTEFSGWALDLPPSGPQHRFLSAGGVGVDPAIGQPWIVGPFDSDGDGVRDNFTTRRYNPATGIDNLGFGLSSAHGTIVDVEGIGVNPDGLASGSRDLWFGVLIDINSDTYGDRWGIQRYTFNTGERVVDELISTGFTIDSPDLPPSEMGDTDGDGDVDNLDLGRAFAFFTGPLPAGYVRDNTHGDTDGDTDVDNTDLANIIASFTGATAAASKTTAGASLLYNPTTGESFIDQAGSPTNSVVNFVLATDGNFNTASSLLPVAGQLTTSRIDEISATDATLAGLTTGVDGLASLGAIFPVGLNAAELDGFLTTRTYVPGLGHSGAQLKLVMIPEPSGILLLGVAVTGLMVVRKNHRSCKRSVEGAAHPRVALSITRQVGLVVAMVLLLTATTTAAIPGLDALLDPEKVSVSPTNIIGPPSTARDTSLTENSAAYAATTAQARKLATPYQSIRGNWITTQNPGADLSTIGSLVQSRYDNLITPLMNTPATNSISTENMELVYPTNYFNNTSPVTVYARRFTISGADGRTLVGYYLNYDKVDPLNKEVLLQVNGHFGANPSKEGIGLQNRGGLTGAALGKLAMQGIPLITYDDHNVGESSGGPNNLGRTLENLQMVDRDILTEFDRVDGLGLSGGTERLYHFVNFHQSNLKSVNYSGWNVPGWFPYDATNDPGSSPYGVNGDTYVGAFHENFQYSDLILNGISKDVETTFAHNAFEGGGSKYGYHFEVAPTLRQYTDKFFNLGDDPDGNGTPNRGSGLSHEYNLEDVQRFLQWTRSDAYLRYDPFDGSVELDQADAAGNTIINFVLQNTGVGSGFQTGVANLPYSGALTTDTATELSQSDPVQLGLPSDRHNLGAIFPAGMDQGALESFLTRHTYVGELGSGERELTLLVLSADYNRNGIVDTADYTLWQDSIGEFVLPATGADGNGDGIIDQADYAFWKERFGTVVNGTGTTSSNAVPEPSCASLVVLTFVLLLAVSSRFVRDLHNLSATMFGGSLFCCSKQKTCQA
jgi:hypothetical protein